VTFEGTVDGVNWVATAVLPPVAGGSRALATTETAPGIYQMNVAGFTQVSARVSAYTSGTVTAAANRSAAHPPTQ